MASRLAALTKRFHSKPRPSLPAWATENTTQVQALAQVNQEIVWAVESTGLLETLRSGLIGLDGQSDRGETD
jgi:hypothetical protein